MQRQSRIDYPCKFGNNRVPQCPDQHWMGLMLNGDKVKNAAVARRNLHHQWSIQYVVPDLEMPYSNRHLVHSLLAHTQYSFLRAEVMFLVPLQALGYLMLQ